MTGRTVWLASYPKSGNTWFRAVFAAWRKEDPFALHATDPIASLRAQLDPALGLETSDLTAEETDRLRPQVDEAIDALADAPHLRKIHDALLTPDGASIVSVARHAVRGVPRPRPARRRGELRPPHGPDRRAGDRAAVLARRRASTPGRTTSPRRPASISAPGPSTCSAGSTARRSRCTSCATRTAWPTPSPPSVRRCGSPASTSARTSCATPSAAPRSRPCRSGNAPRVSPSGSAGRRSSAAGRPAGGGTSSTRPSRPGSRRRTPRSCGASATSTPRRRLRRGRRCPAAQSSDASA